MSHFIMDLIQAQQPQPQTTVLGSTELRYEDIGNGRAYNADCFDVMKTMPDGCVDMILADLPYGTTACKWDTVIPFEPMWKEFHRICKPNGAIVLTAVQPFSAFLVASNVENFKHSWIWDKGVGVNFMHAKRQPLKNTEDVFVFSKGSPAYFPIMTPKDKPIKKSNNIMGQSSGYSVDANDSRYVGKIYTESYPTQTLNFSSREGGQRSKFHPTQKPVALFEYLIKTYTKENDLVFDPTAGSLTTGVAAENLGRRWVCCEKDTEHGYFEKGIARFTPSQTTNNKP